MSQIKKVSSVYIRLATPGTINTPKTYSSLEASRADSNVHQKLVPSAPKPRNYPNRHGNRGTKGRVGTILSALSAADEDFLPPPPPPVPENARDAFHLSKMPLPPPPPLHSFEGPAPSSTDSKETRLQRPYVGGAPNPQEFPAPSESERHSIPSLGFKLEDSLTQTVNNKLNGLPDSGPDICAFCNQLIPPTILAVNTMNKIFHEDCFKCRKCRCRLAGKTYYNLDGNPHCDSCYQDTMEKCGKCRKVIMDQIIRAMDKAFHPECFTCVVCHRLIGSGRFGVNQANEINCLEDFQRRYAPKCCVCKTPIIPETAKEECLNIELFGLHFHVNCYRCEKCGILLSPDPTEEGCFPLNKRVLCKTCHMCLSTSSTI